MPTPPGHLLRGADLSDGVGGQHTRVEFGQVSSVEGLGTVGACTVSGGVSEAGRGGRVEGCGCATRLSRPPFVVGPKGA